MRILSLIYILLTFFPFCGIKAQESSGISSQLVAVGTEMKYIADIDDVSDFINFYWNLKNENGVIIKNKVGSKPMWLLSYKDVPTGKYFLSVYAASHPPYDCESNIVEMAIEVIAQPIVKIVSGDKSGFCSFSRKRANVEEFIFEIAIEGYFGGWTLRYSILDPYGNIVIIDGEKQQKYHFVDVKTEKLILRLGDMFVNEENKEAFYTVKIDEVLLDGEGATPLILNDKVKIGILPVVNIGKIDSENIE